MDNQSDELLFPQRQRIRQQDITPATIKNSRLSSDIITSTQTTVNGPISLVTGTSVVVQSIIVGNPNPNLPIAAVPYCIVFFETTPDTNNMIGVTLTGSGYLIKGPFALPTFMPRASNNPITYGGSNGNNLVFITELFNNTGATKTIYYYTNTRYIQGSGGALR